MTDRNFVQANGNNIILKVAIITALIVYGLWINKKQKKRKEENENLLEVEYNF